MLLCGPSASLSQYLICNRFSFLGSIPGPIALGALMDKACILWGKDCGDTTSCLVYNNSDMRTNFFILPLLIRVLTLILFLVGTWCYKPIEEQDSEKRRADDMVNADQNNDKGIDNEVFKLSAT